MMVRFDCGCVGLLGIQGDAEERPLILYPCDLNGEECWTPLSFYRRDMSDKGHEPLDTERAEKLVRDIALLMADGYRFRRMKELLK